VLTILSIPTFHSFLEKNEEMKANGSEYSLCSFSSLTVFLSLLFFHAFLHAFLEEEEKNGKKCPFISSCKCLDMCMFWTGLRGHINSSPPFAYVSSSVSAFSSSHS